MIFGFRAQQCGGAQTHRRAPTLQQRSQGAVVHYIMRPEFSHAVTLKSVPAHGHCPAPGLGEGRKSLQKTHQQHAERIGQCDRSLIARLHGMIPRAEGRFAPGHRPRKTTRKIRPGQMGAVAEDIDVSRVAHGGHALQTVVVFLAATLSRPGRHMPHGGKILAQPAYQFRRGLFRRGRHQHRHQVGIILVQQAFQSIGHARMRARHRDNHGGPGPAALRRKASGRPLFLRLADQGAPATRQKIQQTALGQASAKPECQH